MASSKKNLLVVNVLFWIVGALLHPLASLLPTGSGETPKILSVLIPIFFLILAFGSTYMMARALSQQKDASDGNAEHGVSPDGGGIK